MAQTWVRGPARRDRDQIIIDGTRAERYEPFALERSVGVALARVRTPDDAVAFAKAFGLLTRSASTLDSAPIPTVLQQPYADFERAAEDLRRILRWTLDVREAVKGDRSALARVREDFPPVDPDADIPLTTEVGIERVKARYVYAHAPDRFARDDRTVLIRATHWATVLLMNGLIDVQAYPYAPAHLFPQAQHSPGEICLAFLGETLLDYCYVTVAHALAKEPLRLCEECSRVFLVRRGQQRFCETACANRARFNRFKFKQQTNAKPTRRPRHGKSTRKR